MVRAPQKLKAWRRARKLTVTQAADLVPCTRQTWHSWERGIDKGGSIPPSNMMTRVCELTGVEPNDFYVLPHLDAPPAGDDDDSQEPQPPVENSQRERGVNAHPEREAA
jgi:transcriptional regulator with XRE-family HTH domain